MDRLRVCFSCPMARPAFEPHFQGPFGGSEVRAFLFATGLVNHAIDVTVVVDAHGPAADRLINGVSLTFRRLPDELPRLRDQPSHMRRWSQMPIVTVRRLSRSFTKRWRQVCTKRPCVDRVLARTDADVYCAFGVHEHAASVIHTANRLGRPSVLLLASDTDLAESYRLHATERNAYGQRVDLCYQALQGATCLVAQTHHQQRLLRERFGRDAALVRNPLPPIGPAATGNQPPAVAADVLWIGRADRFSKRADLAMELARRCGALRFCMIMNRRDARVHEQISASLPANVQRIDHVPWRDIHQYFQSSSILLNTSDAEGFPNTFLQAAQHGRPIVSLNVDPDGMLSRHGAGTVTHGDLDQTSRVLQALAADDGQRAERGAAARQYVQRYHAADRCCQDLARVLAQVASGGACRHTAQLQHAREEYAA